MNARAACMVAGLALLVGLGGLWPERGQAQDLDYQRLAARLDHLRADPVLGHYALAERAHARDTLDELKRADDDARRHWIYLAKRRIDLAWAAAQLADARQQHAELQREHDAIMLESSRREAARVRHELERVRVQKMAAQEVASRLRERSQSYASQAERARAEAEQAKQLAAARAHAAELSRKQAALAEQAARTLRARLENLKARPGPKGMQMILGGIAFAPGEARLQGEVTQHLGKLVQFVQSSPGKPVLIEGYTDSSGDAQRNLDLSRQRAASVRDALVAAGVDAARIHVKGYGEADPVADNGTPSGRARNRRVVVILAD